MTKNTNMVAKSISIFHNIAIYVPFPHQHTIWQQLCATSVTNHPNQWRNGDSVEVRVCKQQNDLWVKIRVKCRLGSFVMQSKFFFGRRGNESWRVANMAHNCCHVACLYGNRMHVTQYYGIMIWIQQLHWYSPSQSWPWLERTSRKWSEGPGMCVVLTKARNHFEKSPNLLDKYIKHFFNETKFWSLTLKRTTVDAKVHGGPGAMWQKDLTDKRRFGMESWLEKKNTYEFVKWVTRFE